MPDRTWRVPQFPHPAGLGAPGANVPRRRLPHAARQHARARPAPAYQWAHAARIRICRAALRAKHAQGGQGAGASPGLGVVPLGGPPESPEPSRGAPQKPDPSPSPSPRTCSARPGQGARDGGLWPGDPPEGASGDPKCPGHRFSRDHQVPPARSSQRLDPPPPRSPPGEGATLRAQEPGTCSGGLALQAGWSFPGSHLPPHSAQPPRFWGYPHARDLGVPGLRASIPGITGCTHPFKHTRPGP